MQQIVAISEIKNRAEAAGLTLKALAKRAGVNPATAYRGAKGDSDSRASTLRKLTEALTAVEQARLSDLQALHPAKVTAA